MYRVVTERPRVGGGWARIPAKRRDLHLLDEYDDALPPTKEGGVRRRYGYQRKEFSDLIGPLQKFLVKQIGRPWDEVWFEICANLPSDGINARHIKSHVLRMVTTNTVFIDGVVCYNDGFRTDVPITSFRYHRYGQMYVHPETGLLCKAVRK